MKKLIVMSLVLSGLLYAGADDASSVILIGGKNQKAVEEAVDTHIGRYSNPENSDGGAIESQSDTNEAEDSSGNTHDGRYSNPENSDGGAIESQSDTNEAEDSSGNTQQPAPEIINSAISNTVVKAEYTTTGENAEVKMGNVNIKSGKVEHSAISNKISSKNVTATSGHIKSGNIDVENAEIKDSGIQNVTDVTSISTRTGGHIEVGNTKIGDGSQITHSTILNFGGAREVSTGKGGYTKIGNTNIENAKVKDSKFKNIGIGVKVDTQRGRTEIGNINAKSGSEVTNNSEVTNESRAGAIKTTRGTAKIGNINLNKSRISHGTISNKVTVEHANTDPGGNTEIGNVNIGH